jgi:hypothetical protein
VHGLGFWRRILHDRCYKSWQVSVQVRGELGRAGFKEDKIYKRRQVGPSIKYPCISHPKPQRVWETNVSDLKVSKRSSREAI